MSEVDEARHEMYEATKRYDRALERARVRNRLKQPHTAIVNKAGTLLRGWLMIHGKQMSNRDLHEFMEALDEERNAVIQFSGQFQKSRPV